MSLFSFPTPQELSQKQRNWISNWLFLLCFMLLGMIAIGGITRLTGSGLSIMDWQPVSGIIPPLTHREWERLFALYQTIPQYHIQHEGFGLAGFQKIFWAEWIHRFWGRLMGVVLIIPLIYFAIKGMITKRLAACLVLLFFLGALQGGIGWFMVASGFRPDSTAVEPIRLVLHLSAALILYSVLLWTALSVRWPKASLPTNTLGAHSVKILTILSAVLICCTIIAGGLTAGTHAGFSFNSFPLMDGHIFPNDYHALHPFWRNWIENRVAVQFDHRLLATLTFLSIGILLLIGLQTRVNIEQKTKNALMMLGWAICIQYALGITTLLLVVPVWAGTTHQTFAAIVLGIMVYTLHTMRTRSSKL